MSKAFFKILAVCSGTLFSVIFVHGAFQLGILPGLGVLSVIVLAWCAVFYGS